MAARSSSIDDTLHNRYSNLLRLRQWPWRTMIEGNSINRRPRILLGITGSVAAVKGPKLALRLANEVNADVRVVLTRTVEQYFWKEGRAVSSYDAESWREFLASTSTTTQIELDSDDCDSSGSSKGRIFIHYAEEEWTNYKSLQDKVLHIDLRNWADVCLIAPLSAHTLGKIANGLCDDLLTCCMRAWDFGQRFPLNGTIKSRGKPVILAPAMNTAMWHHPLTNMQLKAIQKFAISDADGYTCGNAETGVIIVEPSVKTLACGEIGAGALADLEDIICAVKKCLMQVGREYNLQATSYNKARKCNCMHPPSSKKESMKRALLRYAKQRFDAMKSSHEHYSDQNGSLSNLAAPISPTPNIIIESFLPCLKIDQNSLLVDLGCGDGRWLFAANSFTNCRCLGIDVDEERLTIARNDILKHNLQDLVTVRRQDVFEFVKESEDILAADVIVLYLFREAMADMGTLLRQRLDLNPDREESTTASKSVQILSVGFALAGWTSAYEEKIGGIRVYLYRT